jgi:sigma-B regulation protein RsbU (phosphoserine phosphatase)
MQWLGRVGIAFLLLLAAYLVVETIAPHVVLSVILLIAVIVTGLVLAVRLLRMIARQAVWRLRNRLLVTYLFIAAVPILLIVMLAGAGGEFLARQLAVYLVTSELDRRIDGLVSAGQSVAQTEPAARPSVIERMVNLFYRANYPGIEVLLRDSGNEFRYPNDATLPNPRDGWQPTHGILRRDGQFYLWSYTKTPTGDVTITTPMTRDFLAGLMPNLGTVDFVSGTRRVRGAPSIRLPQAANRYDTEFDWFATVPISDWDKPGTVSNGLLVVWSRVSAVLGTVFNRKADMVQGSLVISLIIGLIVFFIVEIVSVVIGITMTRTITGAVHLLYQGTQRVTEGDFSHRIEVTGKDQLADLSRSFNSMTENVQRLLVVAKEKERLQSEIEIAREVQGQLYPRVIPQMRQLRLAAICQPARMVSGDYYDYEIVRESQIALAIGDVAGKGISAALLMATLQSSLRTQLQNWLEVAAVAGTVSYAAPVSTSQLVGRLNNQLYAYTSPEKYATFCLGIFDEKNSVFTYTNAGHLPPLLVRDGAAQRLDVNGTVVGAFPFSKFDESRIDLKPNDLLVCYTDGVTEPENEYGEMFGEERLTDLVEKNAHRSEEQIIELLLASVHQWTASEELQDDMTILLARRV